MNKERLELFAHLTLTLLGVGILAFLFFKYLFVALLPFIISWAAAFLLRPAVRLVSEKTHIPRKAVSVSLTILCVILGLGLISLLGFFAVKELWEFFSRLAADERVIEILARLTSPIGSIFGSEEASNALTEHIGSAIEEGISGLVARLVSILSGVAASIPKVLFFILVTVIASVYFALDLDRINSFVKGLLPEKAAASLSKIKSGCISVGAKYLKAYLIIMSITFGITLIGFLILRVRSAILIAVFISLLDLLPVIGVGTMLVPWSVAELLLGNTGTGVGLILLLVVHELVRQFAEPRIIGKNLGVHPIVSLILLYTGYFVFGIIGLLLVPVLAVVLKIALEGREKKSSP